MTREIKNISTKQIDLQKWITEIKVKNQKEKEELDNENSNIENKNKPRLAFGYGFDPNTLKQGISKIMFSHSLENNTNLYEFEPKLSYRIFSLLAKILNYNFIGSELRKENTIIKNSYFITDQDPNLIKNEINKGLTTIFNEYEPYA